MTWKFYFSAPPKCNTLSFSFSDITVFSDEKFENINIPMWDGKTKMWVTDGSWTSSHSHTVKSFKAFKRHLRKHKELEIEGIEVVLCNKYGFNIIARWKSWSKQ